MKKRTALFLTALLLSALFLCLTACEGGAGDPEGSETEPPKQILYHAADYNDYTIVRSDISSETITHVTVDLRGRMQEAGSTVGIATDWVKRGEEVPETQKEILIGTTNRADSIAACAALRFEEFTVSRTDDHIVIVGGSDEATACAVEWFIDNILSVEEDGFAQYNGKYLYEKTYRLNNATICGEPISGFRIACSWTEAKKAAELLRDTIAAETGYRLELRDTASSQDGKASRIRIEADGKMEKNTYAVLCDEDGILIKGSDILAARCGVSAWINGILSSDTFVYTPGELYSGTVTYREITYYLRSDAKAGGDGSEASPFSTADELTAAIEATAGLDPAKITVIVSAGQYFLSEPLTFTADRFGSIGCTLSMTCPDDEPASFCAWVPVTGFTETTVNGVKAWEAPLPTVRGEQLDAHQFFSASGERLTRPRFPETGFLRVAGVPGISNFKEVERTTPMGALIYGRDEIPHLTHIEDIQMVMYHYWDDERLSLYGVDEEKRVLTFTSDTSMAFHDSGAAAPYFLDNVYEALDAPGEVYSDTEAGKLYYIPREGETRENFVIYASDLDKLLVIDGIHAGEGETVLSFENIAFVGSDWKVEARHSSQAANDIEAAVTLNDIRGVVFRNCDFLHIGNTAVELFKSVSDITFDHCRILDTGAGGFHIAGVNSVDDPDTVPHDITVTDCEIGHYGRVYANAVGILLRYAYDSTLAHNEIYDGYYTGISVGWSWGYNPHATHDILVEKNHIHDIGQQLLSDMGGIYTLGLQPGTVLRGNLIHDVKSRTYGGWGIYPDEGSSDILIENNICYEFSEQPFHQHYGENNLVRNNIFAFGAGGIVAVTKMEDHNSFTLEHNILYTSGHPVYTRKPSESNFTDHDNLIYDTRFSTTPRLLSDNISLEQLQAQGRGIGSIIADPGFTDPQNGDFTLPEDSPAYQIGFTPIDMTDVGIR